MRILLAVCTVVLAAVLSFFVNTKYATCCLLAALSFLLSQGIYNCVAKVLQLFSIFLDSYIISFGRIESKQVILLPYSHRAIETVERTTRSID